ncbi:MAG TPA: ABC transporter substrate-binding protein [Mycobacteriales bacterium]|nr:ABC transporter substrate-binding protein [Mycobacteriales bacterium]
MRLSRRSASLLAMTASLALAATACGSDDDGGGAEGGGDSDAIITVNGTEPQNPLLPVNTNEVGGGRVMDALFDGLVRYNAEGEPENSMAESIETEDSKTFTITLIEDATFTNGEPVDANSFVDAWNFGALITNAQLNAYFFEPIEGYKDVHPDDPTPENEEDPLPEPTAETMSGLKVVDDRTFTVTLSAPQSDFPLRLGYTAFMPLPPQAFEDPDAFGEEPIGNGPYMLDESGWEHDVQIKTVRNPDYKGSADVQNGGITFKIYQDPAAAYADLQAGNLDVLDQIPEDALATFEQDLGDRAINQPAGIFQSITFPLYQPKWSGENAADVRKAISMAINREQITDTIFEGTRTPATDYSSPVVQGHAPGTCEELCSFDPERAKSLLEEAGGVPGNAMTLSYNSDGPHKEWTEAVCNDIKNNLGVACTAKAYPDFAGLRTDVTANKMTDPFRTGWQMDYPAVSNFLGPLYATGAGSNDGGYTNPQFDELLKKGDTAESPEAGIEFYTQAQEVLVEDMPVIPLWYQNATGGYADTVENVTFDVFSRPVYTDITKAG